MEYSDDHFDAGDGVTTRIDQPHEPATIDEPAALAPRRRRPQLATVGGPDIAASEPAEGESEPWAEAPLFVADPPESIPEIVVHHADDLARHLAERLQEVERREVEVARYHEELTLAEAAARAWVMQSDQDLTQRERELKLREDDVSTREAAVAAAEIASQEELRARWTELEQHSASLEQRDAELHDCAERLAAERNALDEAVEKLHAQRRREEELTRSRHQQWQTLVEADRGQLERAMANLQRHRAALDQRERALDAKGKARSKSGAGFRPAAKDSPGTLPLDSALERTQAVRDHRAALEHRWVAGQLWSRLVGRALTSDEQLQESLAQVRSQLEVLYRREREALKEARNSVLAAAKELVG
jgi:hypothetical protein